MADRRAQITNILKGINPLDEQNRRDFAEGFKEDYGIGREDTTKMFYRQRELEGKEPEAPRWDSMLGNHPGLIRTGEVLGTTSDSQREALRESNMNLRGSIAHKGGQMLGTLAGDLTQDRSRSIWWLLNALQATGEVINEKALAKFVPSLYQTSAVPHPTLKRNYLAKNKEDQQRMVRDGLIRIDDTGPDKKIKPARGYSFKDGELHKRNYDPGSDR